MEWSDVEERPGKLGLRFHESAVLGAGMECSELRIYTATRAKVGGDEGDDSIECVITSANSFKQISPNYVANVGKWQCGMTF
jgi:hypothetical protein